MVRYPHHFAATARPVRARLALLLSLVLVGMLPALAARADVKGDIGYTALSLELGGALPTGAGVGVTQVEADGDANATNVAYIPIADAQFSGKTFNDQSSLSVPSDNRSVHARDVGRRFYGNTSSIAPGITDIDNYLAVKPSGPLTGDWLGSGFLGMGTTVAPLIETQRIQNHSWVSGFVDSADTTQALRRLDFMINRDNVVAVVGVNHGDAALTNSSALFSQAYNSIAVGLSSGTHHHGTTTLDGTGRIKPDIVVPETLTSYGTAYVSGAAAMLVQKATAIVSLNDAAKPQVVKALLMAGATKSEFPGWSHTTTQPLDSTFGAGELNIQHSYHALVAGQQEASGASTVATQGWDYNTALTTATGRTYYFDVEADEAISELSVILTWHRIVSDGPGAGFGNLLSTLANLSLFLYSADGFTLDQLLDSSVSTVDNVEHIYYTDGLGPGRYALQVTSDTLGSEYGLAWVSTTIPEPATWLVVMIIGPGLLGRRSRRRRS
ncbi:MAG: hypothetical protein WD042_01740 [Phycisphaeraceae bacterium]